MDEIPRKPHEHGICKKEIANNKNRTCLFYYGYYDNVPRIALSLSLQECVKTFS